MRHALTVLFLLLSPVAGVGAALAQEEPAPPSVEPPPLQTPDPSQVPATPTPPPQTPMLPSRGRDCESEQPAIS